MDIEHFRTRLLEERDRLRHAVAYLHDEREGAQADEGENELSTADNHLGDQATNTYDRELDDGLEEGGRGVLVQIDIALKRIEDGTYGKCERCGRDIGEERLEARPWATLCIDDARAEGA
jgi:RNA polymerase-binding protein DksA